MTTPNTSGEERSSDATLSAICVELNQLARDPALPDSLTDRLFELAEVGFARLRGEAP